MTHVLVTLAYVSLAAFVMVKLNNVLWQPGCPMCGAKRPDMHSRECPENK